MIYAQNDEFLRKNRNRMTNYNLKLYFKGGVNETIYSDKTN